MFGKMGEVETAFAEIVWEHGPLSSGMTGNRWMRSL